MDKREKVKEILEQCDPLSISREQLADEICDVCLTEMPDHPPLKLGGCPYCGYRHPPDGSCV